MTKPDHQDNRPSVRMVTVHADDSGQRRDNLLLREVKGVPRTRLYRALRKGEVRVNKGRIKADYRLCAGDIVRIPPLRQATKPEQAQAPKYLQQELQDRIVFENDENRRGGMLAIIEQFDEKSESERNIHLLQVLLFDLLADSNKHVSSRIKDSDINRFLHLVDTNFKEQHSVQYYLQELNVSDKKLGAVTKKHLGMSPLQTIHRRIVLEIKRLLLFGEESHKEIANSLGSDRPASFSAFVKKRTDKTPTQLQTEMEQIHN